MDSPMMSKGKKGVISKTWEKCKSFSGGQHAQKMKTKSWPRGFSMKTEYLKKSKKTGPEAEGCFSIYVGEEKKRFVIKTEHVNHSLFKILLEEAESEYGFSRDGPLMLPCEVDHFIKVLMEIIGIKQKGCNFVARTHTSYNYRSVS